MGFINIVIAILIILIIFFVFNKIDAKHRKKKKLKKLQDQWGCPKLEYINFDKAAIYSNHEQERTFHRLSSQTMADIDFDHLFSKVDRTTSKVGQQYLYNILKRPTDSIIELKRLDDQVTFFYNHKDLREEIQLELLKLNSNDSYYIALLLSEKLIERPKWFKWLFLDSFLLVLCLTLSIRYPIFLIFTLLVFAFNASYLHYWNKKHILVFSKSLSQLNILINISRVISKKSIPFNNSLIKSGIAVFKKFQHKINILYMDYSQKGPADITQLPLYLFEILKSLFLIDLYTFFNLIKSIEENQAHVSNLFKYIGNIDTSISVASLRAGEPNYCKPDFITQSKKIAVKNLVHPLIINCVSNSINMQSKSVLITGSNMSGKTTFLRTLAVNSLLAQTIYTCFGDEYTAPFLKLASSIRIDDDLFEGKSYYLAEVEAMGALIMETNSGHQNLFILDEVFKGTNTIERIAAAKAILSYLNRGNNIVFVSTHDIELSNMLVDEYDLYHFTETIEDSQLFFDHKLKAGPLKTKNAIKILEISKYPDDIIREANCISLRLSDSEPK